MICLLKDFNLRFIVVIFFSFLLSIKLFVVSDYLEGINKLHSATNAIKYISTEFIKSVNMKPENYSNYLDYYNSLTVHANDIISVSMGSNLSIFTFDEKLAINKNNIADKSILDEMIYDLYRDVLFDIDSKGITIVKKVSSSMHQGCQLCHVVVQDTELGYIKLFNAFDLKKFLLFFCILFVFVIFFYSFYEQIIRTKKRESSLDVLTGLPNRSAFKSLKPYRSKQVFCFLDIDHFKRINDTYGHDIGDRAIRAFAHCLSQNIRKSDIAFRWGGEEFLLILREGISEEIDPFLILESLRRRIQAIDIIDIPKFTVSIGYCDYDDNVDVKELINKADLALYESKRTGRNKVTRYKDSIIFANT